jgi:DNA-binding MarR family transcriptional regulator
MAHDPVPHAGSAEPSGREVIAAARLFHRVLRTRLNQCFDREFALTYAQYEILQILEEEPNLHASELARRLRMTRQATNRLVTRLDLQDLVGVGPRDGSIRVVWLTDAGKRRLTTARESVMGVERDIEKLPAHTRIVLVDALGAGRIALIPPPCPGGGTERTIPSPSYSSGE